MSDGQQQQRRSGQSSKATTAISPPNEPKSLPPIKHLPLRKRLALEASIKITPKVSPKEEVVAESQPATAEEEYPPTPGSQHSSSSSGGSSDSTIPIVHSPPSPPPQKSEKVLKQPLKKAYHWAKGKGTTGGTTTTTTTTTIAATKSSSGSSTMNRNKLTVNNGGLPGNPLLLNNGDADKYDHWTSAEDTINSFKSAWLGEDDTDDSDDREEEKEPVVEHKIKKTNSKRGRPSVVSRKSTNHSEPSSSVVAAKVRKTSTGRSTAEGKLYCVCRQPYDATRFMIACDRCDDWFHGECIGINEKESEFVDLYFCTKCSKITGKKSSWKPKCANPACHKAARIGSQLGHLSKYCSDSCGMQVARARLELVEIKRRNNSRNNNNTTASIPIAQLALMKQRQLRINSFADKEDRNRLTQIRMEKLKIRDNVQAIDKKIVFLNELKLKHPQRKEENDDNDSKTHGPCGFDSRLILDDLFWKGNHDLSSQNYTKCTIDNCTKHNDWQKLLTLEVDQERKEQFQYLAILEKERNQIKERMRSRRSEKDLIKDLINGTISV